MDLRAIKDKATELFSKGKFAKAAETYEQYCKADPKDLQARLRMGDAWSKSGKKDRAIVAYQAAAEGFAKDGFLPRAIAASKLVLELDPGHKGIAQMLADLYARKSGATRPATARTIGAKPDPVAAPVPSPMNRADAIEISIEEDAPQTAPPPPPPGADATEVPIEVDGAQPPPSPVSSADGIEIELGSQPVSGEVEVPILGTEVEVDSGLPKPGDLPRELEAARSYELDPPTAPSAPSAKLEPIVDLDQVVLDPPPPPPKPEPIVELEQVVVDPAPPPRPEPIVELEQVVVEPPPPPRPEPIVELEQVVVEPPPPPRPEPIVELEQVVVEPPSPPKTESIVDLQQVVPPPREVAERPTALLDPVVERVPSQPPAAHPAPEALEAPRVSEIDPPASKPARVVIDEPAVDADEVVLLTKKVSPKPEASAPPGLKPKHSPAASPPAQPPRAAEPPRSSPSSRIWLPPAFQAPPPAAAGPAPVSAVTGPSLDTAPEPQSELEKSLEAFTQFDVDAPPAPQPARAAAPKVPDFTELELEGDSLLQAVEAAASVATGIPQSSASVSSSAEEAMEAPEEHKPGSGALPKIPLFSDLPEDAFIALFEGCPLRRAEPGERIIEQGSQGTSFYVICSGRVRVLKTDGETTREIAIIEEGSFFGEMALLSDAPRIASVEAAAEDTQLLEIPAHVLTDLSTRFPTVATALKKFCRQRLLSHLMSTAALFRPFTKSERRDLVQRFRARDAGPGEVLIKQGQPSDGLYVVLTGEVSVQMNDRQVATLREGQVFGEMSLLTRSPTTATVKTTRKTSFLRLPKEDFDQLIMSHPQILEAVAELTDERKRQNAALQARPNATNSMV